MKGDVSVRGEGARVRGGVRVRGEVERRRRRRLLANGGWKTVNEMTMEMVLAVVVVAVNVVALAALVVGVRRNGRSVGVAAAMAGRRSGRSGRVVVVTALLEVPAAVTALALAGALPLQDGRGSRLAVVATVGGRARDRGRRGRRR